MPNRTSTVMIGMNHFLSYHLLRSKCVLEITALLLSCSMAKNIDRQGKLKPQRQVAAQSAATCLWGFMP